MKISQVVCNRNVGFFFALLCIKQEFNIWHVTGTVRGNFARRTKISLLLTTFFDVHRFYCQDVICRFSKHSHLKPAWVDVGADYKGNLNQSNPSKNDDNKTFEILSIHDHYCLVRVKL